jgi:Leucine-rich repeat (LRR) protein
MRVLSRASQDKRMRRERDGRASKKDAKAARRFGSERGVDYDDIVRPVSSIRPPSLSNADNTDDTLGDGHGQISTATAKTTSSNIIEKVPRRSRDRRRREDQSKDRRRREDQDDEEQQWKPSARQRRGREDQDDEEQTISSGIIEKVPRRSRDRRRREDQSKDRRRREEQDDEEQPRKPSARQRRANKMYESDDESDYEEAAPGAVSVPGIRSRQEGSPAELLEDTIMVDQGQQAYNRTSSNEDVVAVPIEATLATESAEIEQLQAEKEALRRQLEEQQRNKPPTFANETILEAEIINPNAVDYHSKRSTSPMPWGLSGRCWALIALLGVIVVSTVVLLVVLLPGETTETDDESTSAPSADSTRRPELHNIFRNISGPVIFEENSPQFRAIEWLVGDGYSAFPLDDPTKTRILEERYALAVLFFATGGDLSRRVDSVEQDVIQQEGWSDTHKFLDPSSVCDWNRPVSVNSDFRLTGVLCNELPGDVARVLLGSNELKGSLPSEITLLSNLEILDLNSNELSGSILASTLLLVSDKLNELSLSENQLFGSIPSEIGLFTGLRVLELSNNLFTGRFPTEVWNLVSLNTLSFSDNQVSGRIPSEIGLMATLGKLEVSNNLLNGTLPKEIANLSMLSALPLSDNQFSGSIPTEIGLLTDLSVLELNGNALAGTFPPQLLALSLLRVLSLSNNQVSGSIPSEIGRLTNLQVLEFSSNDLSGRFPPELSNLSLLQTATFEFNQLRGNLDICRNDTLDRLVADCADDGVLCVCCTSCCSDVTQDCQLPSGFDELEIFSLLVREFGDVVLEPDTPHNLAAQWIVSPQGLPADVTRLLQRYILALFYYQTSENGTSPWRSCNPPSEFEDDTCTFLEFAKLANDDIIYAPRPGSVRWLSSQDECNWEGVLCTGTTVSGIQIFGQQLSGPLPTELRLLPFLSQISLAYNELTGTIPPNLANIGRLDTFEVHGNLLTGTIPEEFYEAEIVRFISRLNVGDNLLSGTLDTRIGFLWNLRGFHIFENNFEGTFPTEISNLSSLTSTRFNGNEFSGTLPTEFGSLARLSELWAHGNLFAGTIPTQLGNLRQLQELRLWGNQMTGTIPSEIYNLRDLNRLSIREMALTGTLSTMVGQLTNLLILRVSTNRLTGTIPSEIENLKQLRLAWLHLNQFEGELPPNICDITGVDRLEFLQADCMPVGNPPNPCVCCSACCDRDTGVCLLAQDVL